MRNSGFRILDSDSDCHPWYKCSQMKNTKTNKNTKREAISFKMALELSHQDASKIFWSKKGFAKEVSEISGNKVFFVNFDA